MNNEEAIKRLEWLRMVGNHVDSVTLGKEDMPFFDMAIFALREQEERNKGCKACEMTTRGLTYKQIEYGTLRGDFINDSSGMYIIRYGGGQHSIVCDDDGAEIDIEFCPMCGRRLEEVCPEE